MTPLQRLADALAALVSTTGPYAPGILFFATLVEYVFPPFPGDLLVVLGAWYAVEGAISWPLTFVSVTAGGLAGAWLDHRVGAALGRRLDARAARHGALSVQARRLERFEASYRRWGGWLLVANRFLPGVRAFIFIGAGASRIPLRRVLLLGGLSAALWNAVLLAAGAFLAHNQEELIQLVHRYTRVAWAALAACALLWVLGIAWRRAARRRAAAAGEEEA
ncbi:DedA family protein [Anaeromyxobacter dehalogenans]|uniref:DedA n=1 Tax=Anaeromyxobacter dehalogenans (strain 2CP-C) TaxID=290397 RepID=Q2IMB2_ANADE|nr:DedA family protein [Anaeromyxobacter dehalogenans]ABC79944.1 DedA [Anaeromyxobacter dehalogenans 2CP-C]